MFGRQCGLQAKAGEGLHLEEKLQGVEPDVEGPGEEEGNASTTFHASRRRIHDIS